MTVLALLTDLGAAALADALITAVPVTITEIAVGSVGGDLTGEETMLGSEIARVAVGGLSRTEGVATVSALFDDGSVGIDHAVREIGLFDGLGRLIFHAAVSAPATLGALTPLTGYAVSVQVAMAAAPAGMIEFVDPVADPSLLVLNRVSALEIRAETARRASLRNLFLATSD